MTVFGFLVILAVLAFVGSIIYGLTEFCHSEDNAENYFA